MMLPAIRYGFPPALAVLTGLLLLLATAERAEAQDLDNGVVKLVVTTHGGMGRTGSGFLVRLDGDRAYIVTAARVVDGAKETGVVFKAHRLDPPVAATVVGPEHWDILGNGGPGIGPELLAAIIGQGGVGHLAEEQGMIGVCVPVVPG